MTPVAGIEGKLVITLSLVDEVNTKVQASIQSERPVIASQIFNHQPWQRALDTLPLLFNICGQAQSVAGVRAIESAMEAPASANVEASRDLLIDLESLREHLWRMLVDWPQLSGQPTQVTLLVPLNKTISELLRGANADGILTTQPGLQQSSSKDFLGVWLEFRQQLETLLFGSEYPAWLHGEAVEGSDVLKQLKQHFKQDSQNPVDSCFAALPWLDEAFLLEQLQGSDAERFTTAPSFKNMTVETGPMARQKGQPLVEAWLRDAGDGIATRMAVRLLETAQLLKRITTRLIDGDVHHYTPMKGGLSQVEAVRGRLIHSVTLEKNKVSDYRILAPTEWNFSDVGIAVALLNRLTGRDKKLLSLQARQIIQAVDPCVGFELKQGWAT